MEQHKKGRFCRAYSYYNRGYDWDTSQRMAERAIREEQEYFRYKDGRSETPRKEPAVALRERQPVPEPEGSPPRRHSRRAAHREHRDHRGASADRARSRSRRRHSHGRRRTSHREDSERKQKLESRIDSALAKYPRRSADRPRPRSSKDTKQKPLASTREKKKEESEESSAEAEESEEEESDGCVPDPPEEVKSAAVGQTASSKKAASAKAGAGGAKQVKPEATTARATSSAAGTEQQQNLVKGLLATAIREVLHSDK